MEYSTHNCRKRGHPEVVVECDEQLAFDVPRLINALEEMVLNGSVFLPEQTFQLGWSILLFKKRHDGRLTLHELDMSGKPGQFVCSVSRTMMVMRRQMAVLESFGIENQLSCPSLRQTAVACNRFATTAKPYLIREKGTAHDSGWFFGCRDKHDHNDVANLVGGSLYEHACSHLEVLDFLAMPVGSMIILKSDRSLLEAIDQNNQKLKIQKDSYLDMKRS